MGNCLKSTRTSSELFVITSNERRQNQENEVTSMQPPPPYQAEDPILHPTPGVSRPVSQLTEEEQVTIAIRLGLINTLPLFKFEEEKREKLVECIICMCEYEIGEELRYLPCLHTYHKTCIDDWLTRSFVCPSCLDEVDIALMRSPKTTKIKTPEKNQSNSEDTQVILISVFGDQGEGMSDSSVTETGQCTGHQHDNLSELNETVKFDSCEELSNEKVVEHNEESTVVSAVTIREATDQENEIEVDQPNTET